MSNRSLAFGSRATVTSLPIQCGWQRVRIGKGGLSIASDRDRSVRDDTGKKQGTMLVEVLESESTDSRGHWFKAKYILASDSHLRWWMVSGAGAALAKKCRYHCCDGNASDCPEVKKGKGMHFEKFREIGQSELDAKVPAWAFSRSCVKAYLKGRDAVDVPAQGDPSLPWHERGGSSHSEGEDSGSGEGVDLKAKLEEARDAVKKLEKRLARGDGKKDKKEKRRPERDRGRSQKREAKHDRSPARGGEGDGKKKKRKSQSRSCRRRRSSRSKKRRPKASSPSKGGERSLSESEDPFGGGGSDGGDRRHGGRRDRGPFGGGEAVDFKERSDSETESFRDAPADRTAVSQLRLGQYAKKKPGRLASRLLLKMHRETSSPNG